MPPLSIIILVVGSFARILFNELAYGVVVSSVCFQKETGGLDIEAQIGNLQRLKAQMAKPSHDPYLLRPAELEEALMPRPSGV